MSGRTPSPHERNSAARPALTSHAELSARADALAAEIDRHLGQRSTGRTTGAPRAVYRFLSWTVAPDLEPDAEPLTYQAECAVCGKRSPRFEHTENVSRWILHHAARRLGHHSYREIVTRPVRAWPTHGLPT